ncbi:MAG: zinc ribbon domain-containing protein [Oscillospiraceae bacterium]|nr:zinc ribbon domain-containing protein [Oscillospiraceae bacterium]
MEKKGNAQKKIAAVLLVVSFVMAFLPWISIRMDLGIEGVHTLKGAYAYAAREDGTSTREVRREFLSSMENMIERTIETMKEAGVKTRLTSKQYLNTYKAMEDGLISPNELGSMTVVMSRLYRMELDYFKKIGGSYGTYNAQLAKVQTIKSSLTTAAVLLWIGMILLFASFLLACRGLWKGDKRTAVPYAAVWLLLCIYVLIVVGQLNTPEMAQMWPTTLNGSVSGEVKFRFMVWPIFGLLLAVGFCVVSHTSHKVLPAAVPVKAVGWRCPACGAMCDDDAAFCSSCGARKPEPRRCPGCGQIVEEDSVFCANCGTRLPAPVSVSGETP